MKYNDDYAKVARIYNLLEWGYSLGAIGRAKAAAISQIMPDEQVLIAGCGTASEIRHAIAPGAKLVLLDHSPSMLRLVPPKPEVATIHCGDLFEYQPKQRFDLIIAPFFCNVFVAEDLERLFATFKALCRRHGRLCIVDFKYPSPSPAALGVLQRCYWWLPMLVSSWIIGEEAHPPLDYRPYLSITGWQVQEQQHFLLPMLPIGFELLLLQQIDS